MAKEVKETEPAQPVAKYLKHPVSGEIFPYSPAIAINPYLIPTDEAPDWAKDAETVKKGPFGRPVKIED